jgi:hypothetical protein
MVSNGDWPVASEKLAVVTLALLPGPPEPPTALPIDVPTPIAFAYAPPPLPPVLTMMPESFDLQPLASLARMPDEATPPVVIDVPACVETATRPLFSPLPPARGSGEKFGLAVPASPPRVRPGT